MQPGSPFLSQTQHALQALALKMLDTVRGAGGPGQMPPIASMQVSDYIEDN